MTPTRTWRKRQRRPQAETAGGGGGCQSAVVGHLPERSRPSASLCCPPPRCECPPCVADCEPPPLTQRRQRDALLQSCQTGWSSCSLSHNRHTRLHAHSSGTSQKIEKCSARVDCTSPCSVVLPCCQTHTLQQPSDTAFEDTYDTTRMPHRVKSIYSCRSKPRQVAVRQEHERRAAGAQSVVRSVSAKTEAQWMQRLSLNGRTTLSRRSLNKTQRRVTLRVEHG